MKNKQPANANPKVLAFLQGTIIQKIVLFIPRFKTNWIDDIKLIPAISYNSQKKLWLLPYSTHSIKKLEDTFGEDILFAFKVGNQLGNHKTDQ